MTGEGHQPHQSGKQLIADVAALLRCWLHWEQLLSYNSEDKSMAGL
jgi:hypothetical protein